MSAFIDGYVEQINNELISKEEYTRRRLQHLSLYFRPRTIERGTAGIQAQQVFGPSFMPLSMEEINEREEQQSIRLSDPIEFHNGVPGPNVTYTMDYYEDSRAWMFQRIANVDRVSAEAEIVFHRRSNVLLATMDVLKRELGAKIRPLLPLPLIVPSHEEPKIRPYAPQYLPLTAIKRLVLSAAEMDQVLDVSKGARLSLSSWKYAVVDQSDTSTSESSSDDSAGPILGESAPHESSSLAAAPLATENTRKTPEREASANADEAFEVAPAAGTVSFAAAIAGSSQETAFGAYPDLAISGLIASPRKIQTRSLTTNNPSPASHANEALEAGHSVASLPQKIHDIVTGYDLPATKAEAEHSARERRNLLLLSAHRLPDPSERLSLGTHTAEAYPLFPEFARNNRSAGEILCICGRDNEEDFEGEWVGCDTCGIWQHLECMDEDVPLDRKQRYECQQCDPLRHRELLARLRRENPLPQEVMPEAT